ncbi:MAG: MFS transporter [Acidobacteriota bacterium]
MGRSPNGNRRQYLGHDFRFRRPSTMENGLSIEETVRASAPTASDGWRRVFKRVGIDVRQGEWRPALLLFLCFFLIVAFQYSTKSVRQSTYVRGLGAANLPWVYLAVALCSYPVLRLYSKLADRIRRHHLMAVTCGLIAASMVVFFWLFQFEWPWVPFALYVWISIAYVMNISQFWSFSSHVFDPRQAKRLFGFIGAGGLLGGVAGGQLAGFVSGLVETRTNFLVAATLLLLVAVLILATEHAYPVDASTVAGTSGDSAGAHSRGGFELIKSSKQLRYIAVLMTLSVVVAQVVDIPFNWTVEQSTQNLDDATRFFGNFYSVMNIAAFIFQLFFTSRIHRLAGVGPAMRFLPIVVALGSTAVLLAFYLVPRALLGAVLGLKMGENGTRYSLDQSTRELLFLPVPSKTRIKAKAYIDVFVQRGAKGIASLILLPVTPAIGLISPPVLATWMAFPLIVLWLFVARYAYNEYVRSFRSGLKQRSVDTEVPINMADISTLSLLVQALGSSDRRQVLQSLELLSSNRRSNLVPPLLLYHEDAVIRRRTLTILAEAGRVDALPLIERALSDDDPDVRAEAVEVLAALHGDDACELMLAKLSEKDPGVRAAALACLANQCEEEMLEAATSTLEDLLSDADGDVRCEGAKALGAIYEPRFQTRLINLLYDSDTDVVQEAIAAIRRRVARDGYNPLYVPTLVSLLQNRKVRHEAREALVAFGEPAIPALTHFMGDPDEPLWVRRALPMTIAKIGTLAAAKALTDRLVEGWDEFQRRKLIIALTALPEQIRRSIDGVLLQEQIGVEATKYLQTLADLNALGLSSKGQMKGPLVDWDSETLDPSLVERLLGEKLETHLDNMFGLLAIQFPQRHVWAAHRSLVSGSRVLINNALEYLDNTLSGEIRQHVFSVIDDRPLADILQFAARHYGVQRAGREATMARMLQESNHPNTQENHLALATLYLVRTERLEGLYSVVKDLLNRAADPFVNETVTWVAERVGLIEA